MANFNAFTHFDIPTLCKLLSIAQYKMFKAGDFICGHEDLAELMLVVVSGAASIIMNDRIKTQISYANCTLYPGDHIGAAPLSLILSQPSQFFHLEAQ